MRFFCAKHLSSIWILEVLLPDVLVLYKESRDSDYSFTSMTLRGIRLILVRVMVEGTSSDAVRKL